MGPHRASIVTETLAQDERPIRSTRVAMALYGYLTFDSRVQREAIALAAAGYDVTIYCLGGEVSLGAADIGGDRLRVRSWVPTRSAVIPRSTSPLTASGRRSRIRRLLDSWRWLYGYVRNLHAWGDWAMASAGVPDVWHVHDLTGLMAVGRRVRAPSRLVYDSHEIFLETGSGARLPRPARRGLTRYEGRLTRRADALITVNDGLAAHLTAEHRPRRSLVVRNCSPRWQPTDSDHRRLRTSLKIPDGSPIALYHGVLSRNRGIEQLLEAILEPGLTSMHVVLLGYGEFRDELQRLAAHERFADRVHMLDAVPPTELLGWVAGADVGIVAVQESSLNHLLSTPNKLWECLAAGVPVVVSDFQVMREIVLGDPTGPLGAVCDPAQPASIAAAIRDIIDPSDDDLSTMRRRCLQSAHDRWNWETESVKLLALYDEIRPSDPPRQPSQTPFG